jgi:hypothetical protein
MKKLIRKHKRDIFYVAIILYLVYRGKQLFCKVSDGIKSFIEPENKSKSQEKVNHRILDPETYERANDKHLS